ncbi:MAG: DNA replication and repair protein RecF [Tissierellia bacterium]|nr:DNA replication and repair protein RecF [Tissierellia bacterium]
MRINYARLINYRNYADEEFFFSSDLEFILGDNAQGKTNLLEAIYLACTGKAFRARSSKEAFFNRKLPFRLELEFSQGEDKSKFIYTHKDNKPLIHVNNIQIERRSELFGRFPMVLFSPEHLRMLREGPSHRRNFFDREISLVSPSYFYSLVQYQRLLRSRNILLKENYDPLQMDVYEEKLALYGKKLYETRGLFVEALNEKSSRVHDFISGGKEVLNLSYKSSFAGVEDPRGRYREDRKKDLALGYTSFGPQGDDMYIEIDKKDARRFASQGQARIASLSIFFGLLPFISEQLDKKPLVLLDDVFSELDRFRRHQLLELLQDHQVILTTTDLDGLDVSHLKHFNKTTILEGKKYV